MNREKATMILIRAAEAAQKSGVFTLKEAVAVARAVEFMANSESSSNDDELKDNPGTADETEESTEKHAS